MNFNVCMNRVCLWQVPGIVGWQDITHRRAAKWADLQVTIRALGVNHNSKWHYPQKNSQLGWFGSHNSHNNCESKTVGHISVIFLTHKSYFGDREEAKWTNVQVTIQTLTKDLQLILFFNIFTIHVVQDLILVFFCLP